MLTPLEQKDTFLCRQAQKCAFWRRGKSKEGVRRCKPQWGLQPNERCQLCWLAAIVLAAKRQERGAATSDEPLL